MYSMRCLQKLAGKFQDQYNRDQAHSSGIDGDCGYDLPVLVNGMTAQNMAVSATVASGAVSNPLLTAVCATAFAYEGWIIATSINAELKDAKRNLPKALVIGGFIVVITYIGYFIGVAGGATNQELIDSGATVAFTNIFGNVLGNILNLFIAISCIGTMNGLMLGCCRGMYSLAARNQGPKTRRSSARLTPKPICQPTRPSLAWCSVRCGGWHFYLSQLSASPNSWVGPFVFDSSELPIITGVSALLADFYSVDEKSHRYGRR